MRFFLKSRQGKYEAQAEYDEDKETFTVLKGSVVSDTILKSPKFRSSKAIERDREKNVVDKIVINDVIFKSPSTAANFIAGSSKNGCILWKNIDGVSYKDVYGKRTSEKNRK